MIRPHEPGVDPPMTDAGQRRLIQQAKGMTCRTILGMNIVNTVEARTNGSGKRYTVSLYRYLPPEPVEVLLNAHDQNVPFTLR